MTACPVAQASFSAILGATGASPCRGEEVWLCRDHDREDREPGGWGLA